MSSQIQQYYQSKSFIYLLVPLVDDKFQAVTFSHLGDM